MKIGLASDHRGYRLKEELKELLLDLDFEVVDYGTDSNERTDYQIYGIRLGEAVRDKNVEYGVAICGSAIGISIAANKVQSVRCAKVDTINEVCHAKELDFANMIAISGELSDEKALELTTTLIYTENSTDPVYYNRVKEIEAYESRIS